MTQIRNFNFGNGTKATIYCKSRNTRNGFAHDCVIPALGVRATVHYLNRTWERFDFETVIRNAFEKFLCKIYFGKANEKVRTREYKKLIKRLDAAYDKGKIEYVSDFEQMFARAA